jgi:hypothetical protein
MQKFLGPQNNSRVPIPHLQPIGWSGDEGSASTKCTNQRE